MLRIAVVLTVLLFTVAMASATGVGRFQQELDMCTGRHEASYAQQVSGCTIIIEHMHEIVPQASPDLWVLMISESYMYRAVAHQHLGDIVRAEADFNESVRLTPDHAPTFIERGRFFLGSWRLIKAREDFRTAIKLDPDSANAHWHLGIIYERLGQKIHAMIEYQTVLRLTPDFTEARTRFDKLQNTK